MRVATDIGGTFTDLVSVDKHGKITVAKSHTTPPNFEQGVINVISKSQVDPKEIEVFFHGTTVIINALTERKGAKTGLITTKGFRDVLEIGRANRPDLYNVRFEKPKPFVPRYLRCEVEERLNYKGEVLVPLNKDDVKAALEYLKKEGVEAVAVAYLHSYANPVHEEETVALIKELWPDVAVTASYEVTKEWREYERTSTTVLNSYVKPVASRYIDKLDTKLKEIGMKSKEYIMQSNGGTTTFEQSKVAPINMVESGPVAGVFGSAVLGQMVGAQNVIAFDIGGTTAKCSLVEKGEVKVSTEYKIEKTDRTAGYPVKVPVVDIVEIGNGGGSIAWIDGGGSLRVGPKSAGALPGPVAYGKGGTEPTTTDACLLTGRLSAKNFDYEVDFDAVKKAVNEKIAKKLGLSVEDAALGIIRIADSNMLNALKLISVRKGYDPRDFSLVAFGGGGPMHAPILARELGVKKVIIPVGASVFSAWGMLMTDLRHDYVQTYIRRTYELNLDELNNQWQALENEALAQFKAEDFSKDRIRFSYYADMRYLGQEHTVKVLVPAGPWKKEDIDEANARFHRDHEQNYSFKLEGAATEIVNLHLVAFGLVEKPEMSKIETMKDPLETAIMEIRPVLYEKDGWLDTKVYDRAKLGAGVTIEGPVIVEEPTASTVLAKGQSVTVDAYGNLIIETGVR
ncbi:MAG TPA: hydantoinase/oxoprolinase family protein [Clostridia bacterium]|nr:hydantoinase/oxoprolinase family protein [Clostridia bacterium]